MDLPAPSLAVCQPFMRGAALWRCADFRGDEVAAWPGRDDARWAAPQQPAGLGAACGFASSSASALACAKLLRMDTNLRSGRVGARSSSRRHLGESMRLAAVSATQAPVAADQEVPAEASSAESSERGARRAAALERAAQLEKEGLWKEVLRVLDDLRREDIVPDEALYRTGLRVCARGGLNKAAARLLSEMRANSVAPDALAFCDAAAATAGASYPREAFKLIVEDLRARRSQGARGLVAPRTLLEDEARELLSEMWRKRLDPPERSREKTIREAARTNKWRLVLRLYDDLGRRGLQPSREEFRSTLKATSLQGCWSSALDILAAYRRAGCETDRTVYHMAMTACWYGRRPREAGELFDDMTTEGFVPTPHSYRILAGAVGTGPAGALWTTGLQLLEEVATRDGDSMFASTYGDCIHGCLKAGEWEAAWSLLQEAQELYSAERGRLVWQSVNVYNSMTLALVAAGKPSLVEHLLSNQRVNPSWRRLKGREDMMARLVAQVKEAQETDKASEE
eukprot:TRINITY_DN112269_c0_g1_i1.p1 TRINITY_DN112269_c0_g1~~TRINITY_DN112269_c0_g1_i1.p1  ORF type:complete len:557 (-),score=108.65 TRINITY_DN112269_c0_g1_i1:153-1691(-)